MQGSENAKFKFGGSMRVGTKIYALSAFFVTLLVFVAVASLWQMQKIGLEIEGVAERDLPLTRALTQVTVHQLEQAINLERAFRAAEAMDGQPAASEEFTKAVQAYKTLDGKVDKELGQAKGFVENAMGAVHLEAERAEFGNVLATLENIDARHKRYGHHFEDAVRLISAGQLRDALDKVPQLESEQEKLNHAMEDLLVKVESFTEGAAKNANAHEKSALVLLALISAIAILAGICVSFLLVSRSVARPLADIVEGLDALNAGNLSVSVPVHNEDEIGRVAQAFETFRAGMMRSTELEAEREVQKRKAIAEKREMMNQLADDFDNTLGAIVESVSSASTELTSTAQAMSGIAEETSSQANAIAAASEEAAANVRSVAAASEEMSASFVEINGQISDASAASQKAVDDVSTTAGQMHSLKQTANKIGEVVSIISDIAEQTNLLALNATIESARAGDAGKGFAVVASEVKALANETAKATEGISQLIEEIQSATTDAVNSIDGIGSIIDRLDKTSLAIKGAMDEQGLATQEVSRNVSEAASGTQEVSSSISGMTKAAQEAGAASDQVMSAASELSQQSERMKYEVQNFLARVRAG